MSFENEEQLGYIEDARRNEWPSALACEIWANLMDENKPSDTIAVAEMLKKMMNLKLSSGEDPKKVGERIAMVQAGYTCRVDKNHKIATVVSAGGKAYANTIQQETMLYEIKNEKMTAKRLIKAMQQNFRLKGGEESDDESERWRQHWLWVTFLGNATIAENQGTRGRIVQRSQNLSPALEGTKANSMNMGDWAQAIGLLGERRK